MRKYWDSLKKAFTGFMEDNAFKLSASLSYYTVFSIGPVLIIIISLAGVFFGREAVQGRIYSQIKGLVGPEAAAQIQEIIKNIQHTDGGTIGTIVGVALLIIGSTGVFIEMQDSINSIWSVKAKPKKGWKKFIFNRVTSFSLIVSMGFILLVSLIVSAVLDSMSERLQRFFPDITIYLFYGINIIVMLAVISFLFAVIFKVLPDAHITWKDAFTGAVFTSLLFLVGKFAISFYLGQSDLGVTYGAAASIVILLTWVYYSSLILFFGAEFTKMYAINHGGGITPSETAVFIVKRESKEIPTA
jgi:membrane protein